MEFYQNERVISYLCNYIVKSTHGTFQGLLVLWKQFFNLNR